MYLIMECSIQSLKSPKWCHHTLALGAILATVLMMALPALDLPWSLIDDPTHIVEFPRQMLFGIEQGVWVGSLHDQPGLITTEFYRGRFRPVAWHYFLLAYITLGSNGPAHHMLRFSLLAATVISIYLIAVALTKSASSGFLSAICFLLFSPGWEGVYRLSPQELPLVALQAVSLATLTWALARIRAGKISRGSLLPLQIAASVGFVLSAGMKEASVAIVPFLICLIPLYRLSFGNTQTQVWHRTALPVVIIGVVAEVLLVVALFVGGAIAGQGSEYRLITGITIAVRNLAWYSWTLIRTYGLLLLVALGNFAVNLVRIWRRRSKLTEVDYWQILWLVWLIGGILFQSPWRAIIERYLVPYVLGLALFLGIELNRLLALLPTLPRNRRRLYAIVLAGGMFFAVWENVTWGTTIYRWLYARDTSSYEFTEYIAHEAPPNTRIWVNTPVPGEIGSESTSGLTRALRIFWHREDVLISPLDNADLQSCCDGEWVGAWGYVAAIPPEKVSALLSDRSKLVWENEYVARRLWGPGAWVEWLLLNGPVALPNRAPQKSYTFAWQVYDVQP